MSQLPITTLVGGAGFVAGMAFGAIANKTNFCTMGAISDIVFMQDWRRMRAWLLAIAVAMLATQAMNAAGVIDTGKSIYLTPNFGWLGAILGGLLFGFGMTMAGGCANKTLVRIGGGNLKSIVVLLVIGVFAYMTLRGLIGAGRVQMEAVANIDLTRHSLASQGLPDMLAALTGLAPKIARWIVTGALAGGLLIFCFGDAAFRASPINIFAGLAVGLLIASGWWITGVLGNDDFSPTALGSFSFVAPIGDSLEYLMTYTGATINFGIASVGGVIAGSFLTALVTRRFQLESFVDTADMVRHLFGASIMGIGGVLALGCTIGQGVTGVSTLAAGSVIALLSILAGGALGMKYLEQGSFGGALTAILGARLKSRIRSNEGEKMKLFLAGLLAMFFAVAPVLAEDLATPKPDWDHPRKILLQLDSENLDKVNLVLNNALNTQAFYGPDNVKIAIVAFGPGLRAVLKDSNAAARVASAVYAHVEFLACGQTMKSMHKRAEDLLPGVTMTEAGVPTIVERQLKGWAYIAP